MAIYDNKINLLPKDEKEPRVLARVKNIVSRTSFIVLATYLIFLVGLFGANFFVSQKREEIAQERARLVSEVQALSREEGLLQIAKNRVTIARSVLSGTSTAPTSNLETVLALVPGQMSLTEVGVDATKITISGESSSSTVLAELASSLEQSNAFSGAVLKDLSKLTNTYKFSIEITK